MKKTKPIPVPWAIYPGIQTLNYGSARRAWIMQLFLQDPHGKLPVNRSHCAQVKHDPDLKKLIKQGILTQIKIGGNNPLKRKKPSSRHTYLVLTKSLQAGLVD